MSSVTARTRIDGSPAFLLGRGSNAGPCANSLPNRLFPISKEKLRIRLYAMLFGIDVLLMTFAFLAAGDIRLGSPFEQQSLRTLAVMIPTFTAIAIHNRAYSIGALQRPSRGAAKVAEALGYAIAVAIALLFYMKASVQFSRQIFAMGTVLAMAFGIAGRFAAGAYINRKYGGSFVNRLVILDGFFAPTQGGEVVVSAGELGIAPGDDNPVLLDRFGHALEGCDSVVIACSSARRGKWSHALKAAAVDVEILTPELDDFQAIGIGQFGGHRTLKVSARPLNIRDRVLKRALDVVIASAALVLLGPLMIFTAIAIAADSGGPVLFRQQRVGRNNRLFNLLKFRSFSHACADPRGDCSVSRVDERMTRVGKFIRRTSIDELPQLFNVLAGDMSIVGPRPHALGSTAEDALFWKIDPRYFHRHVVKPGMTGLAQIRGYRGATVCRHDLTNRLQSDLEYLCDWTIWRDLRIIAATFGVIFHPNAF
ncbi:polysaccharide biosynthesis protein PslA [Sphingomonas sp. F9_3S_D5_B_2]